MDWGVTLVGFCPIQKSRRTVENLAGQLVDKPSQIRKIAFLGDYLPRKCGIATLSLDDALAAIE